MLTEQEKANRIEQLKREIESAVTELTTLVNATPDETEQVWDDAWELSGDKNYSIEMLDESLRVLNFREVVKERNKAEGGAT